MSDPAVPDVTGEDRAVIVDSSSHPRIYELLLQLEEVRAKADLLIEENRSITMQLEALVHRRVLYADAGQRRLAGHRGPAGRDRAGRPGDGQAPRPARCTTRSPPLRWTAPR